MSSEEESYDYKPVTPVLTIPNYWEKELSSTDNLEDIALIRLGLTSLQVKLRSNPLKPGEMPESLTASLIFHQNTVDYNTQDFSNDKLSINYYYPLMFLQKPVTQYECDNIFNFPILNPNSNCPEVELNLKSKKYVVRSEVLLSMLIKNAIMKIHWISGFNYNTW